MNFPLPGESLKVRFDLHSTIMSFHKKKVLSNDVNVKIQVRCTWILTLTFLDNTFSFGMTQLWWSTGKSCFISIIFIVNYSHLQFVNIWQPLSKQFFRNWDFESTLPKIVRSIINVTGLPLFFLSTLKDFMMLLLSRLLTSSFGHLENILLEQLDSQLEQLDSEGIQKAANTFLGKENYIELILLPEELKNN